MFDEGDLVYHPDYGTGVITSTKSFAMGGVEQLYYVVKLTIGEVLIVPIKEAEEARLHPLISPEAIIDVLSAPPQALDDDFRQRRTHIEQLINSGDPKQVGAALRDLAWRERTARLSNGDRTLMDNARKLLSNLLVSQPDLDMKAASKRLDAILKQASEDWQDPGDD